MLYAVDRFKAWTLQLLTRSEQTVYTSVSSAANILHWKFQIHRRRNGYS